MKIISILNNSALIARNEKNEEVVLIGKGLSFQKHPNDEVDASKIEKVFQMNTAKTNELMELFQTIPEKYFDTTSTIVRYARKKLKKDLDKTIYITMTDHICSAIERYHDGIELNYGLLNELKQLYSEEYEVAQWALDYVNAAFDVELPVDESGFMATHIISAVGHTDLGFAKKIMTIVKSVESAVIKYYDGRIHQEGLIYSRFITHLKYFAMRYLKHEQIDDKEGILFKLSPDVIKQVEPCIRKVVPMLEQKYNNELTEYERLYLMLHLYLLLQKNQN